MLEAELSGAQLAALRVRDADALSALGASLDADEETRDDIVGLFSELLAGAPVTLSLRLARGGREQLIEGLVGPGALLLTVAPHHPDARGHAVLGVDTELPRVVADLVDLGPRPYSAEHDEIVLPFEPLDAFGGAGCDEATLAAIHATFDGLHEPDDLAAIFDGTSLRWSFAMWTEGREDDPQVSIDVLDGRDRGLWTLWPGPEDGSVAVRPTTSTAVWLMITGTLDAIGADLPGLAR